MRVSMAKARERHVKSSLVGHGTTTSDPLPAEDTIKVRSNLQSEAMTIHSI